MSFEIRYEYRNVGVTLVDELLLLVQRAESFVLLGCQGGGKRLVLAMLGRRLREENRRYLSVFFPDNEAIVTEAELLKKLTGRLVNHSCPEIVAALAGSSSLDDWFYRLSRTGHGSSLPISFANIDCLAQPLKEQFLAHIRNSVERRHLVVGLTGESLLARTLARETSPFKCVYQFVLTGHDLECSRVFFLKRVEACSLKFSDDADPSWNTEAAFKCLFNYSGGNVNILRAILWCLSERRLRYDNSLPEHTGYRKCEIEGFSFYRALPLFGFKPFHAAKSLIEQDRDVLGRLEDLLDKVLLAIDQGQPEHEACLTACIEVPEATAKPEALELAGILRRDPDMTHLRFASIYVAEFALRYFSWTCRGDFHAKQGDWPTAFSRYRLVTAPERRWRPINEQDFRIMRTIVNRLCREFAELATKQDALVHLPHLLEDAGQLLFGLSNARILQLSEDGRWSPIGETEVVGGFDDIIRQLCETEPAPSALRHPGESYFLHLNATKRTLLVLTRPGKDELKPRHALLFESQPRGPVIENLRQRLLETVATNFLTCYNDARMRLRTLGSRFRLADATQRLFQEESVLHSLEALGSYLKTEFFASGVRLFLIDAQSGDLRSSKSWGYKNLALKHAFDSGSLVLKKGSDPELWAALVEKKPISFRWCPPDHHTISASTTDLHYRRIESNAYSALVERNPGDYWIDFPLFVGEQPFGKLTLAFLSDAAPPQRYVEDLGVISEILGQHLRQLDLAAVKLAEMRTLQQRAIAVAAHDLATRIVALPLLLAEYSTLEETIAPEHQDDLPSINARFRAKLNSVMHVLERAKLQLSEVRPVHSDVDLIEVAREALRLIASDKGLGTTIISHPGEDTKFIISGDQSHLEGVFSELVSDSISMFLAQSGLKVQVAFSSPQADNRVIIDYIDNGPGVPDDLKEKIFEYFFSHRPGQRRKGMGLGLAYVRETLQAHGGSIVEIGKFGQGSHFKIILPIRSPSP
ncbi:sensor protein ZraS [mine drainage metagenome]|uniref:histidine kinase n=1 Tax=mine drainage metagenome TaxID=410659 RepID=A0A1J5QUU7_9ZZZZ